MFNDNATGVRQRVLESRLCGRIAEISQDDCGISFEPHRARSTDWAALKVGIQGIVIGLQHPGQIEPCVAGAGC